MTLICTHCAKAPSIKALIESKGTVSTCDLCLLEALSIDSTCNELNQLCKALIRFNFNEWDYNSHWGGQEIEHLFRGPDNIFFIEPNDDKSEAYDELIQNQIAKPYEDYEKGITIYAGYTNGHQNLLLSAIKNEISESITSIADRLLKVNHYELEDELKAILEIFKTNATTTIEIGQSLNRARIGVSERKTFIGSGFISEEHFSPYTNEKIGAPSPQLATHGRANRAGVSFFYGATESHTAISEVRPHPNDVVSVGLFKVINPIKAFDLTKDLIGYYSNSDRELDIFCLYNSLAKVINQTITPKDQSSKYLITQLIADCIRLLGFDALIFQSTVGSGLNVVLFDQKSIKIESSGGKVFRINKVNYETSEETVVDTNNSYLEDFKKQAKP